MPPSMRCQHGLEIPRNPTATDRQTGERKRHVTSLSCTGLARKTIKTLAHGDTVKTRRRTVGAIQSSWKSRFKAKELAKKMAQADRAPDNMCGGQKTNARSSSGGRNHSGQKGGRSGGKKATAASASSALLDKNDGGDSSSAQPSGSGTPNARTGAQLTSPAGCCMPVQVCFAFTAAIVINGRQHRW